MKKIQTPSLSKLKSKPCSIEELQLALVNSIELHNELVLKINEMIAEGRILSSNAAKMNNKYGL